MLSMFRSKSEMVPADAALVGRDVPVPTSDNHFVLNTPLKEVPAGMEVAIFGMGCFWGVERIFWQLDGVFSTSVGYTAGYTPNATYEEVCTGKTGHNEVVRVVFNPAKISYDQLLQVFWEGHDPTTGMRQGNDVGTQYRSGIYTTTDAQVVAAQASKAAFEPRLSEADYGTITTEILPAPEYYFAEGYHQQYLAKNPNGYCGIGGTGVTCPIGTNV
ncbi:MAG: peptide-methionine (S)-S-oxide reductase MsrA [Yoonia sp.]|nr:peptide-methionine (S)-S-oxide reductase MsrA [Yoonia sp.]